MSNKNKVFFYILPCNGLNPFTC